MITALLVASIVIAVVLYGLCNIAGESDDRKEKWIEQREKEQESFKWCTDECLHCDENDWCKFSEVK